MGASAGTRTFVKICGITRPEDAHVAVRAGADAVGFVFAPSPRRISPSDARAIADRLHPSVRRIGVFVDEALAALLQIVDAAGLDGVQLQGSESAQFVIDLRAQRPSLTIFKVVRSPSVEELAKAEGQGIDAVFIDPKNSADPMAPVNRIPVDSLRNLSIRFIVAGGLTPSNVGALVSEVRPWGVDVSGGVEDQPGKKDPDKVRSFIRAVRDAERP
jgi:phosphoribosylanthranilate isomerase